MDDLRRIYTMKRNILFAVLQQMTHVKFEYKYIFCLLVEKMSNPCKATIQQGPRKGSPCENRTDTAYCLKHIRVGLIEEAKEKDIRYCDIARGCVAVLEEGQVSCKTCLHKARIRDRTVDGKKRSDPNLCLDCGVHMNVENRAKGKHDKLLRRCMTCYEKHRMIEDNRPKRERNYKWEGFQNKHVTWNHYVKSAKKRNLDFTLSKALFESLLIQPCFYCGHSIPNQINGIDRVDNNKGYIEGNVVPCCEICNTLKGTNHPQEFIDKLYTVHEYAVTNIPIKQEWIEQWSSTFLSRGTPIYSSYFKSAQSRSIPFVLSEDEFKTIISQSCYLCGLESSATNSNGIDRFDNNSGYVLDNCRPCCGHCNLLKKDIPYEILIQQARKIHKIYNELLHTIQSYNIPIRISKLEKRVTKDTPVVAESIGRIYKPINEIIVPSPIMPSLTTLLKQDIKKEISPPKQWKVKQIFEAIQQNNEHLYKEHCEQNNDLSNDIDWPLTWSTFVLSVKEKSFAASESTIRAFVENLRRIRHNQLCYDKNKSIIERKDRQQWPATTIVRAFLEGKIEHFKEYTEKQTGDDPESPTWQKRWNTFIKSLEENKEEDDELQALCSKFLTAQRTKRYRHQIDTTTPSTEIIK